MEQSTDSYMRGTPAIVQGAQDSENETQRKAREVRTKEVMRVYENAEDRRIEEKNDNLA